MENGFVARRSGASASYAGSVLAIDPKGELALASASVREKLGQRVCVLDPFGTTGGKLEAYRTGFNPVGLMGAASMIEDAVLIADALVVSGGGGDPHWDESARTFIEGVILEVATAQRFGGRRDLVTVRDLIAQGESFEDAEAGETLSGMTVLEGYMRESPEGAVRRAAADFFDRPERERDSVLSTARRHLRALSFPEIERSLRGEGFGLAGLKKRGHDGLFVPAWPSCGNVRQVAAPVRQSGFAGDGENARLSRRRVSRPVRAG